MKVLISDKLSPRAAAIFAERGIEADVRTGLSPEELAAIIGGYDGLAIRSATKVTAALLEAADRLKVVGRAGIGVDNVDRAAATRRGVVVMNTPFGNAITTAEHTIAMLLACARQIPAATASTRAGRWEKSRFMGAEVFGKTLGLVGAGNIGAIVADRAQGLKMKVVAYDPYLSDARATELGVEKVDFDALLSRADFITAHTPLNDATRGLINAEALARAKNGVRIINCARGGIVDEAALLAALESGHVAGAALDVFAEEPARENPLFARDDVVCTPHLGASTREAQENVAVQVAAQMADYLLTGAVTNAVNMPSVSMEDAPRLRPYIQLASQLGSLAGQIAPAAPCAISVEFEDHAATLNTRPMAQAALAGVLETFCDTVNMVSAPALARERGLKVSETRHDQSGDYQTMIRVRVETEDGGSTAVHGTLFGGRYVRVVEINGIKVEASLSPHMLFVTNRDVPGLIGGLGAVLGAAGVNIATFHLGRATQGGEAMALMQLDTSLPESLLEDVRAVDAVTGARTLAFSMD